MRAWLILAILLISSGPCAAAVEAVNIYEPRAFGYFIGDTFERRIEVVTTGDTELLTAGLPRPGPLTYWLELTGVDRTADPLVWNVSERFQGQEDIHINALGRKQADENGRKLAGILGTAPGFDFVASPLRRTCHEPEPETLHRRV